MSFGYPIVKLLKDKIDVVFTGFLLDTSLSSMFITKDIVNAKSDKELFNILKQELSRMNVEVI